MGLRLLIAEPRFIYRTGLCTLFSHDSRTQCIHEAINVVDLQTKLRSNTIDFVIINQTFITSIDLLPKDNFVIITDKPDKAIFDAALTHGLRGYLLDSSLEDWIRLTLDLPPTHCLIDPALLRWAVKVPSLDDTFSAIAHQVLTPREQEILALREIGRSYQHIADQLCISKETVKKHLQHIARKLNKELEQR